MGSEHYCLRWNNHQSNLLGVFSQLLQDESLVDVTLACSEGASIRAHKVVLSACSSYFQSLFLDHPARHPIVILKDVRFAELRTLVEFMYKGEVNVQYCQLSALLKTAESLKVKGLAEMTNQSTAPRESERDAERLRSHSSIPLKSEHSDTIPTSPLKSTLSTLATSVGGSGCTGSSSSRLAEQQASGERGTPSPTSLRHHQSSSPTPLALYGSRRVPRDHPDRPPSMEVTMEDEPLRLSTQSTTATTTTTTVTCLPSEDRPTSPDDDDDDDHMMQSNDVGLNMTLNSTVSATSSIVIPAASVSSSELRPASRGGHTTATCISSSNSSGGGGGPPSQVSPSMSEPIAGPSGMGPVQQVPLSLKKEIDWDRGDDKDSSSSDYRHSHETEATPADAHMSGGNQAGGGGPIFPCMYCGASFPHQSKLTRHILSHSLETLKYRETPHLLHPSHLSNLLPPPQPHPADLASPSQHFSAAAAAVAAAAAASSRSSMLGESLEPPDGLATPMEIEFAAVAAAAVAASSSAGGTSGISGGGGSGIKSEQGNVVLCKFCGKSFPDVSTLITHLPVHTGDRPFKCEFCGKAFKLRHHMKDHCRVHTGERPFKCSMCGKTFSRSTILKAHEKTHYPKYVRKFLSPSPSDIKDESPQ